MREHKAEKENKALAWTHRVLRWNSCEKSVEKFLGFRQRFKEAEMEQRL